MCMGANIQIRVKQGGTSLPNEVQSDLLEKYQILVYSISNIHQLFQETLWTLKVKGDRQ